MGRSQRAVWNYASGICFTLLGVMTSLFSTPLLVRWLGAERMGAFRAASDWHAYLGLCELGFGGAMFPVFAAAVSNKCKFGLGDALGVAFMIYRRVAAAMIGGGLVLTALIAHLVPVGPSLAADLRIGVLVAVASLAFVPLAPLRPLLEASQRGYVVNCALAAQFFAATGAALLAAKRGWGISGQFASVLLGLCVYHFVVLNRISRQYRGWWHLLRSPAVPPPGEGGGRSRAQAQLRQLNMPTFAFNICGRVALLTDNIVIALLVGPAAVVPFFVTQRLAALATGQIQAVGNATWAAMTDMHAAQQMNLMRSRLIQMTRLTAILGFAVMVPTTGFNHQFVRLWMGEGLFGGGALTLLAGANGIMLSLLSLWYWIYSGTGNVKKIFPVQLVGATVNLGLSVAGTRVFGLAGPLIGSFGAFTLIQGWWMFALLRRDFGVPIRPLLAAVLRPLLLATPLAFVIWYFNPSLQSIGWVGLALAMSSAAFAYLLSAWFYAFTPEDRDEVTAQILRRVAGRRATA